MVKSPIVRFGNSSLRHPCVEVQFPNPDLKQIVMSMFLIMYKDGGVGLAANQVGLTERVAVIDTVGAEKDDDKLVLINPVIIESEGEETMIEGCLSLPDFSHEVKRAIKIKVKNFDYDGKEVIVEASGFLARAIQHEIDHLNGKLFVDRLSNVDKMMIDPKLKKLARLYKKESKGIPV